MQNLQILIISAGKICKQCLQTASDSGDIVPQTAYRDFTPNLFIAFAIIKNWI